MLLDRKVRICADLLLNVCMTYRHRMKVTKLAETGRFISTVPVPYGNHIADLHVK